MYFRSGKRRARGRAPANQRPALSCLLASPQSRRNKPSRSSSPSSKELWTLQKSRKPKKRPKRRKLGSNSNQQLMNFSPIWEPKSVLGEPPKRRRRPRFISGDYCKSKWSFRDGQSWKPLSFWFCKEQNSGKRKRTQLFESSGSRFMIKLLLFWVKEQLEQMGIL